MEHDPCFDAQALEQKIRSEEIYPFDEADVMLPGARWEGYDLEILNTILDA